MKKGKKSGKGVFLRTVIVILLALTVVYLLSSKGDNILASETIAHANTKPVAEKNLEKTVKEKKEQPASSKKETATSKKSVKYELPATKKGEKIIEHTGFVLSFNSQTNNPNWVAWDLTADEVNTKAVSRSNDFKGDPLVDERNRVETTHYVKSGYDRGHMCPAADMKWSSAAMADCFYMTNICPQVPVLNQRWWEHGEEACRRWAKQEGEIYICCGPIYKDNRKAKHIGNKNMQIRVPDAFFKVVLSLKAGEEKAIGFLYANNDKKQTMEDAAVTVDSVEVVTGYDFFNQLNNKLEKRVEAAFDLKSWK